jgi:hypothetical protein
LRRGLQPDRRHRGGRLHGNPDDSDTAARTGNRTFDLLADGGSLTLTLLSQGTVAGRIFVPNGQEGGNVDLSLTGTWGLVGNRITLHLNAGTFLDNLELTASENQLVGVYTSEVAVVHVRLQKPTSND